MNEQKWMHTKLKDWMYEYGRADVDVEAVIVALITSIAWRLISNILFFVNTYSQNCGKIYVKK